MPYFIVNDKDLFTLSFTAPDFGRFSGIFPYKIRAHPPEAYSERQNIFIFHYNIVAGSNNSGQMRITVLFRI